MFSDVSGLGHIQMISIKAPSILIFTDNKSGKGYEELKFSGTWHNKHDILLCYNTKWQSNLSSY